MPEGLPGSQRSILKLGGQRLHGAAVARLLLGDVGGDRAGRAHLAEQPHQDRAQPERREHVVELEVGRHSAGEVLPPRHELVGASDPGQGSSPGRP